MRRYSCEETNRARLKRTPTSPLNNSFLFPFSTYVSHRIIISAISFANLQFICHTSFPSYLLFCLFSRTPARAMCQAPGLAFAHYYSFPSTSLFSFSFYCNSFIFVQCTFKGTFGLALKYANPLDSSYSVFI